MPVPQQIATVPTKKNTDFPQLRLPKYQSPTRSCHHCSLHAALKLSGFEKILNKYLSPKWLKAMIPSCLQSLPAQRTSRNCCFSGWITTADTPRKHNQPPPRQHRPDSNGWNAGAHKKLGLGVALVGRPHRQIHCFFLKLPPTARRGTTCKCDLKCCIKLKTNLNRKMKSKSRTSIFMFLNLVTAKTENWIKHIIFDWLGDTFWISLQIQKYVKWKWYERKWLHYSEANPEIKDQHKN